jgi:cytochrome bd-type quinol oxidase subunit 2
MICPKCNAETTDEAVFCPECGTNIPEILEDATVHVTVEEATTDDALNDVLLETSSEMEDTVVATSDSEASNTIIEPVIPAAAPVHTSASQVLNMSAVHPNVEVSKENKPFSTGSAIGYIILSSIPVVGFIALLIFAIGGKNKNRKSMSRAILILGILCVILTAVAVLVSYLLLKELFTDVVEAESVQEILEIVAEHFGLE